ncbi:hypothetical protein BCR42DRAFT_408692, partial [Absidia repens]
MKTQTLLLGEYDSSAFSIYVIPDNATSTTDYLSIEDLYRLFFRHSQDEIIPLIYTLYQRYPQDFYHDHQNNCYIAKHQVLTLAQSLQLLALAEFCTLTHDELINGIADPLFAITNALMLRPVTPKRMTIDLDWFPLAPASASSPSFFSSFLNSTATQYLNPAKSTTSRPPTYTQNDHSWSRHFLPLQNIKMNHALNFQRQQQAIIECRQRLSVYRQSQAKDHVLKKPPVSSLPPVSIPKMSSSDSSLSSSSSSPEYYHQYQAQIYQQKKRKISPPPPLPSQKISGVMELSLKNLHYHYPTTQQQSSSTMVHNNYQQKKIKSSF